LYSIIKHHGFTLLEGYCSKLTLLNTSTIPLVGHPINTLGSITYLSKLGGVFHSLPKPTRKAIPYLGYSINTMG
jgi:hypothetical protein